MTAGGSSMEDFVVWFCRVYAEELGAYTLEVREHNTRVRYRRLAGSHRSVVRDMDHSCILYYERFMYDNK